MVKVTVNGICREYENGVTYEKLAQEHQAEYDHRIILAIANGKIKELHKTVDRDAAVTFQTLADRVGHDTYIRSAIMLLIKAISDIAGSPRAGKVSVEFSIGRGYYCIPRGELAEKVICADGEEDGQIEAGFVEQVRKRMWELVERRLPISKKAYPTDEAIEIFNAQGMEDKVRLFRYRRGSYINVYCLDGYYDYNYGYMVPDTGYLQYFDLIPYKAGLMLMLPDRSEPETLVPFEPREKLFHTLLRSNDWGEKMEIETVGDLNDKICEGDLAEMILVQEARQERRIAEIAGDIVRRGNVKFVMIAGPSSSGKTTFSHRLAIQLKTHGLIPHPIAVDDYFVDRDKTPLDEEGNYNFECLEAIDVEQFNKDMLALLRGERIELPVFNFKTGHREYKGDFLQLGPEDVLVIEGIHGLNDKLSYALPAESKFKIYISALTQLNIDEHNRIPTTDGRLLRRIVRDARTRGTSAKDTIARWPSVRRGEGANIFPYQEQADVMFNSALVYELACLKVYAEPLLFGIDKSEPEYLEAKRLLKFLDYFISVPSEDIPHNSLLREFVGGSCFDV